MSRSVGVPGPGERVCWKCGGAGQGSTYTGQFPTGYPPCDPCDATGVLDTRPIGVRLDEAYRATIGKRRVSAAFYLGLDDFEEFLAHHRERAIVLFRGKPRDEPAFAGVAVRARKGIDQRGMSRLYCTHGNYVTIPLR